MPQDIADPVEERIIERELNLQNRLYPRPNPKEIPETGIHPKRNRRRRRGSHQRKRARLNYHRVHCKVCSHPERDAIEEAFLMWRRPSELAREFDLGHRTAIYRHAHALDLFQQRARRLRFALEKIMEESTASPPSADAIIRAVRAYSCLDENGDWHEPPRRLEVTHLVAPKSPPDEGGETVQRPLNKPEKEVELFATPSEQKSP